MFSYKPLDKYLKEKGITKAQLIRADVATSGTLNSMVHGKPISMKTLDKILNFLGCNISDVVEHIPEKHIPRPLL